jgi:hypothetical protein
MTLKRDVIELLQSKGISRFILLGEHILNFHGSDDAYYEEWFDEVESANAPGWIAAVNFPDHVRDEMSRYQIDRYVSMGGSLQIEFCVRYTRCVFYELVSSLIQRRLN